MNLVTYLVYYGTACLGKTVITNEYTKETKETGQQHRTTMPDDIVREGSGMRSTRSIRARSNSVRHPLERSRRAWSEPASRICHLHQRGSSRLKDDSY